VKRLHAIFWTLAHRAGVSPEALLNMRAVDVLVAIRRRELS